MEAVLDDYYADNARKLHKVVDKILYKFGGITDKDYDDFYSIANEVFVDAMRRCDRSQSFDVFLYACLSNKIKTEITARNRMKRLADRDTISLDAPVGDGDSTVGDFIQSDFDIDWELSQRTTGFQDGRIEAYLDHLSNMQRKIVEMKIRELPVPDIKKQLGLSDRQYEDHCKEIKSFGNTKFLFADNSKADTREEQTMAATQTLEKSKPDKLNTSSIIKRINRHTIRFDHPLQRESEQWSPAMKSNLISDILQGNPIPPLIFAEQVANGLAVIWDLDGKQRCTNVYSFVHDGFKISKNIRRWQIEYQTLVTNKKGGAKLDGQGFPVCERKECDIRGKKYSDLPEELQDRLNDYNFEIVQYLNCSSEDIAYHIARYNEGKPMTASQKGITRLGEEFASTVKSIAGMTFFKDMGGYKVSEFRNGTINRVVVESVMASYFCNDWKKKQEDMCDYIREHASACTFDDFEDMTERLSKVMTEEVSDMFDSKDSFLWFGLFARFSEKGMDDKRFIEFMTEFGRSLHSDTVNGISFDELNGKSTKDKNVVLAKLNHLELLMEEYFRLE